MRSEIVLFVLCRQTLLLSFILCEVHAFICNAVSVVMLIGSNRRNARSLCWMCEGVSQSKNIFRTASILVDERRRWITT